jgi:hypothetical protein
MTTDVTITLNLRESIQQTDVRAFRSLHFEITVSHTSTLPRSENSKETVNPKIPKYISEVIEFYHSYSEEE